MKNYKNLFFLTFLLAVAGFSLMLPALAKPVDAAQAIYTPTPEENGNIYYIVKAGDTCQTISLIYNVDLDTLRNYNQLELGDCDALTVGRKLLIGIVPTAMVTTGPSPTPTPLPTEIPPQGKGIICIYLFNDINGNAIAETGETALPGGEISIAKADGSFSTTSPTNADDTAVCFNDLDEGQYTISVAIPDGYNATTDQNYTTNLKAGDTSTIDFGAQEGSGLTRPGGSAGSVLLAVLGGLILIVGIGIGIYAYLVSSRR